MTQKVKVAKSTGQCKCGRNVNKKDCRTFIQNKNKVFVCNHCWWYNAPSIFFDYVDMPKQELIFWQPPRPIKWQKKYVL